MNLSLGFFGFWIFLSVFFYVEHRVYLAGHNTLFFHHKTDEEKRIREAQIKLLEAQVEDLQISNSIRKEGL